MKETEKLTREAIFGVLGQVLQSIAWLNFLTPFLQNSPIVKGSFRVFLTLHNILEILQHHKKSCPYYSYIQKSYEQMYLGIG